MNPNGSFILLVSDDTVKAVANNKQEAIERGKALTGSGVVVDRVLRVTASDMSVYGDWDSLDV